MESTTYEELMCMISSFAKERDLIVKYDPFNKDRPYEWGFTLYNEQRSWGYRRLFTTYEHEQINLDKRRYVELVIDDIRKHLKEREE